MSYIVDNVHCLHYNLILIYDYSFGNIQIAYEHEGLKINLTYTLLKRRFRLLVKFSIFHLNSSNSHEKF